METRRIAAIEDANLKRKMERQFLTGDTISRGEVSDYVESVLAYADRQEKKLPKQNREERKHRQRLVILDALQTQTIINRMNKKQLAAEFSFEEIDQALVPIRRAILEEFAKRLDVNDFWLEGRALNAPTEAAPPSSGKKDKTKKIPATRPVIKLLHGPGKKAVYRDMRPFENSAMKEQLSAACQQLQTALAEEPNPHLFPIMAYDPDTSEIITAHRPLATLDDFLRQFATREHLSAEQKRQATRQLMAIVRDCLDAALYLQRKKLVLQDLKAENLGVIPDPSGKGFLGGMFDYDGLIIENTPMFNRWYSIGNVPPELLKNMESDEPRSLPVKVEETAYQFGLIVEKIAEHKNAALSDMERRYIDSVIIGLLQENPNDRGTIKDALRVLDFILETKKPAKGLNTDEKIFTIDAAA